VFLVLISENARSENAIKRGEKDTKADSNCQKLKYIEAGFVIYINEKASPAGNKIPDNLLEELSLITYFLAK
jgi:hypothetical protein